MDDNISSFPKPKSEPKPRRETFLGIIDIRDQSLLPIQIILLLLALWEICQAISHIIWPQQTTDPHIYSHLGTYSLAYASVLVIIAIRPARARAFLVLISIAALGFFVTAILDVVRGNVELAAEIEHLTKLIAPFLVWIIATRIIVFSRPKNNLELNTNKERLPSSEQNNR